MLQFMKAITNTILLNRPGYYTQFPHNSFNAILFTYGELSPGTETIKVAHNAIMSLRATGK